MKPSTTMMKIVTFLSYSVFNDLYYFKKPSRNPKPLSNVLGVDIHSTLAICFILHQMSEGKTEVNLYYEAMRSGPHFH